jgi:hypothetical protein
MYDITIKIIWKPDMGLYNHNPNYLGNRREKTVSICAHIIPSNDADGRHGAKRFNVYLFYF